MLQPLKSFVKDKALLPPQLVVGKGGPVLGSRAATYLRAGLASRASPRCGARAPQAAQPSLLDQKVCQPSVESLITRSSIGRGFLYGWVQGYPGKPYV